MVNTSPFVARTDVLSSGRVTREPQRVARPRFRNELPALVGDFWRRREIANWLAAIRRRLSPQWRGRTHRYVRP